MPRSRSTPEKGSQPKQAAEPAIRRPARSMPGPAAKTAPAVSSFLPTSLILLVLGWGGFYATVTYSEPSGGTRWVFYFTAVLGITGLALPAVAFLNRRFPSTPPPDAGIILRQAIWIGIYPPTLAWLQSGHVLTSFLAMLLAIGLIIIEYLLRLRERSQWRPDA